MEAKTDSGGRGDPEVSQPRMFGGYMGSAKLPWAWATERLTGSLAAPNLVTRPAITVHLESGSQVVIIEGVAEPVSDIVLVEQVVSLYNQKYNWNVDPYNLPGPFYAVRPQVAFGWHFDESELNPESTGLGTATRWRFKQYTDNSHS